MRPITDSIINSAETLKTDLDLHITNIQHFLEKICGVLDQTLKNKRYFIGDSVSVIDIIYFCDFTTVIKMIKKLTVKFWTIENLKNLLAWKQNLLDKCDILNKHEKLLDYAFSDLGAAKVKSFASSVDNFQLEIERNYSKSDNNSIDSPSLRINSVSSITNQTI